MKNTTWAYLFIGAGVLILASIGSFALIDDAEMKWFVLKVVLGLGAAAFVVALPGTINLNVSSKIQATGSLAIFAMIFYFGPQPKAEADSFDVIRVEGRLNLEELSATGSADFSGITFNVTPPKATISPNGRFTVENILIPKSDRNTPICLQIKKNGYIDVVLDVPASDSLKKEEKNKIYTVNNGASIRLQRLPTLSSSPAYNPNGSM